MLTKVNMETKLDVARNKWSDIREIVQTPTVQPDYLTLTLYLEWKPKVSTAKNHTLYRKKLWIHTTIDQSETIKVGLWWVFTMDSLGNNFMVHICFPPFQSTALKTVGSCEYSYFLPQPTPFCCRVPRSH